MARSESRAAGGRPGWKRLLSVVGLVGLAGSAPAGAGEPVLGVSGESSQGLVYVVFGEGTWDVARARLSDGEVRIWETPERKELRASWSSLASRVAIEALAEEERTLRIALWDPASGEESPLPNESAAWQGWAVWSPASTRLGYVYRNGRRSGGIATLDVANRVRSSLLMRPDPSVARPSFAPDGERVLCQRARGRGQGRGIWLLQDSFFPKSVASTPGSDDTDAWFWRDGKSVVFARARAGAKGRDLMSVPLEAREPGEPKTLLGDPERDEYAPRPSPTRDELAYVSAHEGVWDLFLVSVPGGEPRRLTRTPDREELDPVWSPDGELLAFMTRPKPAGEEATPLNPAEARVVVVDRQGRVRFDRPGLRPSWMPPWPAGD